MHCPLQIIINIFTLLYNADCFSFLFIEIEEKQIPVTSHQAQPQTGQTGQQRAAVDTA